MQRSFIFGDHISGMHEIGLSPSQFGELALFLVVNLSLSKFFSK